MGSSARRTVKKYKYKRKPYRHQVAALKTLLQNSFGGALLMEPRTGKTQVCLDFAAIRHEQGKVNRVLIICPVSVIGVWEDEIEAVIPDNIRYTVTVWDREGRKTTELPRMGQDRLDFVIVNVDAFSVAGQITAREPDYVDDEGVIVKGAIHRSRTRGGRFEMKRAFTRWKPQLIILDESHRIKQPMAKKSLTIRGLAKVAEYRIIATGTSVTKRHRVYDLWSQWKFLDPYGWVDEYTFTGFKSEFSRFIKLKNYEKWIRNLNMPKLLSLIHDDSFAVTRDECLDLPPQRVQKIHVDLSPRTAQVYDELAEEMISRLKNGEITEAQIRLVLRMRLCQVTSGIVKTSPSEAHPKGRWVRIGKEKLEIMENRLFDLGEAGEKVVVAARWRHDISSIVRVGKALKLPVYELHGGVDRRQRDINIRQFRTRDEPAVFIMQPSAGSLGIDLSTAATMIWYSLIDSFVDWKQATDRIALAPRGTVVEYLIARGTVDELMLEGLLEDQDVVKAIQRSPDVLRRNFKASSRTR